MRPAAYVDNGASLAQTIGELRSMEAKIFATPDTVAVLENAGVHAIALKEGIERLYAFGHREIHLFGFDLCATEGERICFDSQIYTTTAEQAAQANALLVSAMKLMQKGASVTFHGDGMLQHMARTVLDNAQKRILTAVYDLQVCPPTYEVFTFLSQAEKYRVENGYTDIDVLFLPGPMHGFRDDGLPPAVSERRSMLHRICVSGARLLPSVRDVHVMQSRVPVEGDVFPPDWTNDRPRFLYGPQYHVNGYKCLEATQAAREEIKSRFPNKYTTITMRQAQYWPARNSDFAAWSRAARELQFAGTPAIVIPDTHGQGIPGVAEFPQAAWDIDLRMALYERAELNLGVGNGPFVLMLLSSYRCPHIVFMIPDETSPGTQEAFLQGQGIKKGEHFSKDGWTLWEKDTPDNVIRAIDEWSKMKEAA